MINRPYRHSFRLKEFDYSSNDIFFVTLVAQERQSICGEIIDGKLTLTQAGMMVESWLKEMPSKFPGILLDAYVIMPTHIHFIIIHIGADLDVNVDEEQRYDPPKLSEMVQWFKTMTTNEYIRGVKSGIYQAFNKRVWQRNYHEHIIRDYSDYQAKKEYIRDNPIQWEKDENNPKYCPYLE